MLFRKYFPGLGILATVLDVLVVIAILLFIIHHPQDAGARVSAVWHGLSNDVSQIVIFFESI